MKATLLLTFTAVRALAEGASVPSTALSYRGWLKELPGWRG
jgi:hypothetical protein